MNQSSFLSQTLLAIFVAATAMQDLRAQTQPVTSAPTATEMRVAAVEEFDTNCREGGSTATFKDPVIQRMMRWASEPEVCDCAKARLNAALEQYMLSNGENDVQAFAWTWVQAFVSTWRVKELPFCIMPHVQARMTEQCEPMFTEMLNSQGSEQQQQDLAHARGFSSTDQFLKQACNCIRQVVPLIDSKMVVRETQEENQAWKVETAAGRAYSRKRNAMQRSIDGCLKQKSDAVLPLEAPLPR